MIAVGSGEPSSKKTELLSRSNVWSNQPDYPFGERYIYDYAIVSMKDLFFIFGGVIFDAYSNTIASFSTQTKNWNKCGKLKQKRYGHSVFIQEGKFVVVGGRNGDDNHMYTERCTLKNGKNDCKTIKPELHDYSYYPEMVAVPHDYCPL